MFELTEPSEEFKVISLLLFVAYFGILAWFTRDKK